MDPNDETCRLTSNMRQSAETLPTFGSKLTSHDVLFHFTRSFACSPTTKIPSAETTVEKEWDMLEKLPAWQITSGPNTNEVIHEAQKDGRTVLTQNFGSDQKFQKCKGRVALRRDSVKDDDGSFG